MKIKETPPRKTSNPRPHPKQNGEKNGVRISALMSEGYSQEEAIEITKLERVIASTEKRRLATAEDKNLAEEEKEKRLLKAERILKENNLLLEQLKKERGMLHWQSLGSNPDDGIDRIIRKDTAPPAPPVAPTTTPDATPAPDAKTTNKKTKEREVVKPPKLDPAVTEAYKKAAEEEARRLEALVKARRAPDPSTTTRVSRAPDATPTTAPVTPPSAPIISPDTTRVATPKALDAIASVPLMITRDMTQQLLDMRLKKSEIKKLTPQEAWDIINGKKRPAPAATVAPEKTPTIPTTPEEKAVVKEIAALSPEEKEKIGWGLSTLGFKVEKKKNDFFASVFNGIINGYKIKDRGIKGIGEKGTVGKFCKELRDSFMRDAEEVKKKGVAIQKGEDKAKLRNMGLLVGNILKYGRIVADVTGASIANPLRYVMMGGMITARAAEAGKEARLKNEELINKTRLGRADMGIDGTFSEEDLNDIARAQEEAFAIYEAAQAKEDKEGEETVSAETLKNAYMMQMPKDIQERLKNPDNAYNFLQKILRKDIESAMSRLNKSIEKIENDSGLSSKQMGVAKEKLITRQRKNLEDYDRIVTQYGTVDELAMAGRYAQTIGKTIVVGMQIETVVVSIDKLFHTISNVLSSHDIHPIDSSGKFVKQLWEHKEGRKVVELHGRTITEPNIPAHVATTPDTTHIPSPDSMVVHQGEGVEHTFIRQIEQNPKSFGFTGDINDQHAVKVFAQHEAHVAAMQTGYADNAGHEVRITEANKVAYEIHKDNGEYSVTERTVDGKILGTFNEEDKFGVNPDNQYEKIVDTTHHDTIETRISETGTENPLDSSPVTFPEHGESSELFKTEPLPKYPLHETLTTQVTDTQNTAEGIKAKLHTLYPNNKEIPIQETTTLNTVNTEGITLEQNQYLIRHPEFTMKNPFHLSDGDMVYALEKFEYDITHLFPGNKMDIWHTLQNQRADRLLNQEISQDPFSHYIHKLYEVTHLKPTGGLLGRHETIAHWMARAVQLATVRGDIDKTIISELK